MPVFNEDVVVQYVVYQFMEWSLALCDVITAIIDTSSAVVGTDRIKLAEHYIQASQIVLNHGFDEFIDFSNSATAGRR